MTKQEKIELLIAMHIVMFNAKDKICYEQWVGTGVPDEPFEEDFERIAKNKKEFEYVVNLFCNLVHDFF